MVSSPAMGIEVRPAESFAAGWAGNMERAAAEILMRGGTPQDVSRSLAILHPSIRTLSRRDGCQLSITIPAVVVETLGWDAGMLVVTGINERGEYVIRSANEEDLPGFADRLAEPGYLKPTPARRTCNYKRFERTCQVCGVEMHRVGNTRRFCDECRLKRDRANWREYWHRKGKQTPSYQARLKASAPTETVLNLVPA